MRSEMPKVLHRVAGKPMIDYVLRTASLLSPSSITIVVGHMKEALRDALTGKGTFTFVTQEPQLGTGHALLQAAPVLDTQKGALLLLSGDVPLLQSHTLERLVTAHRERGAVATVLTAELDDPHGYGRILRTDGRIARIVEERDASASERAVKEINSGIFVFSVAHVFGALRGLATSNAQGEYYLTDLVSMFRDQNLCIETVTLDNPDEIRGINSRSELAQASAIVRRKKNDELMAAGVTIEDPSITYIDDEVTVGADTVIHPGVFLEGATKVGSGCELHSGVRIVDSTLDDRVVVKNFCVITGSHLASGVQIGPFAHLRPGSKLEESVHIGNFVELKKAVIGAGTKAGHLAYLGDALVGPNVNIGAGTITCNYDGERKHQTVIEEGAFIGSDSQLVAPVRIGREAYIGSGTTVREDVPSGALGVSAGKQRNIEGWVAEKRAKGKRQRAEGKGQR
jgi:bifunctional UDP-N-acetylglucosamine pyrophosphorylase/glucosamine-1-phosphate N-acetyltransferase